MPRRFRLRIPKPYSWSAGVVVCLVGIAMSVWWFIHGDEELGMLSFAAFLVSALASVQVLRLWAQLTDDEQSDVPLPIQLERLKRLTKAFEFLPEATPPGWSPFVAPRSFNVWRTFVGDVTAVAYAVPWEPGYRLHVTLAHKDDGPQAGVPVPDERAAEIFARLRNVGPFVELESTPKGLADQMPGARSWMALSADAVAAQQKRVPARAPRVVERPLNPHLAAVRRYLPAKLPGGWSAPLAITEVRDGWDQGAWMIEDDEEVALVMLVTSEGRAKLAVTIFHPDKSTVNEAQAMRILKQFRGVYEFVQTPVDGDDLEGARAYLGEIERPTKRAMLN